MGLKLIGEVALDGSGFEHGLTKMAESVKGFIAGAFGLYGIEEMIRKTVDTAKELVTQSQRLGIGVEQLQVLRQAAKEGSTEMDVLAKAFEKLDIAREKALSGSKEGMKLMARFGQLGISPQDLHSQTSAQLFMGPIRDRANSMSPEDLGPILRDVIGKGFGALLPVLATDFEELEKKMRGLGSLMDAGTAAKLKVLEGEFSLLSNILAARFGPALIDVTMVLLKMASGISSTWAAAKAYIKKSPEQQIHDMVVAHGNRPWSQAEKDEFDRNRMQTGKMDGEALAAAKEAGIAKQTEWDAWFKTITDAFAKLEESLKNPTKPDLGGHESDEKGEKSEEFREKGDALLRVGNFLGSSKSVMEDIANKQVLLLQQIADNTKPSPGSGSGYEFSEDDLSNT